MRNGRSRFVVSHPSLERSEGWGTRRFVAGLKGGPPANLDILGTGCIIPLKSGRINLALTCHGLWFLQRNESRRKKPPKLTSHERMEPTMSPQTASLIVCSRTANHSRDCGLTTSCAMRCGKAGDPKVLTNQSTIQLSIPAPVELKRRRRVSKCHHGAYYAQQPPATKRE